MMNGRAVTLLFSMLGGAACRQTPQADAAQMRAVELAREQRLDRRLAMADADPKRVEPVAMWMLPSALREISGLALTADGRLLAHTDEVARVYVMDPRRGVVLKRFTLGSGTHADFEGIAVAGSDIYLLASNGILFQFREGADGASVPYSVHDTRLGHECEFEGVVFDADSAWLLLPCKTIAKKSLRDDLRIYRWKVRDTESPRISMLTIPMAQVIASNKWKGFHPSDITVDPTTGNYVLISSNEKALIEITPEGEVVRSDPLPGKHHQPEGVAITRDNILIVSDEASAQPAAITLYRWRP
jgi:uncharacterized protein YjiK